MSGLFFFSRLRRPRARVWISLAASPIMRVSPEPDVDINIDLIGYCAAALTTSAFVPQAIKTIRSRETHAISFWMYLTFTIGIALWFFYGLALGSWPVIVSNVLTFLLAITILGLKIRYG